MERTLWPLVSWVDSPLKLLEHVEGLFRSGFTTPVDHFNNVITNIACGLEKINMDLDTDIVTLDQIKEAYAYLRHSPDIIRTPTLLHVQSLFAGACESVGPQSEHEGGTEQHSGSGAVNFVNISKVDLFMKMENMQSTGSFKIRGALNQMRKVREKVGADSKLVTMSAGNYGKAFAHCVGRSKVKSMCLMPETAPQNRAILIESMGVEVKRVPSSELQPEVERLVREENYVFCHPFDDVDLIAGYASSALELLEDVAQPDVIVVCCGGGGLVSAVGAAVSLSGLKNCRVYAVEPEGAPGMYESFKSRRPVTLPSVHTVAAGLAPPYAGSICYKHCRWFVEDVILVSDEEILQAMRLMFHRGIKAEPSGCAAMAAVLSGKIPDVEGKKVVVYVTGGNISSLELAELIPEGS